MGRGGISLRGRSGYADITAQTQKRRGRPGDFDRHDRSTEDPPMRASPARSIASVPFPKIGTKIRCDLASNWRSLVLTTIYGGAPNYSRVDRIDRMQFAAH
jgi:hypothetical protein